VAIASAAMLTTAAQGASGDHNGFPFSGGLVGGKAKLTGGSTPSIPATPLDEVVVRLAENVDADAFASTRGLTIASRFLSDDRMLVIGKPAATDLSSLVGTLAADAAVESAFANTVSQRVRYGSPFTPNDPYFPRNQPAVGWPGQWHLKNTINAGRDARVEGAWSAGWTGSGVTIGIVDDGLQRTHADLLANYSAALSYDFGGNDPDPSPAYADDWHGTSVAGVAAARGGNGIGVTGAAPLATLAGLRVDFAVGTTAMFIDATKYLSSGTNTSIKVKNHSYGYRSPYVVDTAESAAFTTSAAAGTVHLVSAGNDRGDVGQDANKKMMQANPSVICVAAMGSDGTWSNYSNFGANVFVTAPSSSNKGTNNATGVTTTDVTGTNGYNTADDTFPDTNYTSRFGGTSSSAPLVSGVMALVKEAQPALDARFAKHLLARTSDVVDAGDATVEGGGDGASAGSAWKTNAAGFTFNMNYGFGLVDATDLVQQSQLYSGVTALQTFSTGAVAVNAPIPDNSLVGVTRTAEVTGLTRPLEEVLVSLNATHTYRGDLEAYLTSPQGTTSRLMLWELYDSSSNLDWTFTSNAFWGESGVGTWSLNLRDRYSGDTGTWNSWSMTLRAGDLVAVPEPSTWALAAVGLAALAVKRPRARSG